MHGGHIYIVYYDKSVNVIFVWGFTGVNMSACAYSQLGLKYSSIACGYNIM